MKFSKINDMKVFSSDAFLIGEISGADVNTKKWMITHLYIELSDEAVTKLGYKKPFFGHISICIPINFIKTIGDVVTLSKNLKELEKLPGCK